MWYHQHAVKRVHSVAISDDKKRLFGVLWVCGMAGVLSLLAIDFGAVVAMIPGTANSEMPHWVVLKLASVAQPTVLVTLAVLAGVWLAPKVGLHAPAAEAFAARRGMWDALGPQVLPGILAGVFSGIVLVASWALARPWMAYEFAARAESFNRIMPAAVRFLYGGLTEEILLRWGMMTFLVWLIWRVLAKSAEWPAPWMFVVSIVGSALLFGAGHLPVASMLAGGLTVPLAVYVVAANSFFGIVAGLLYWRSGLEAAMIAHVFAHVVLLAAVKLAL